jgi:hypothetical protein
MEILPYVYDPNYLMPPCLFVPRILTFDLDLSAEDNGAELALTLYKRISHHALPSTKSLLAALDDPTLLIKLNPLFTLLKVSDLPQKPKGLDGKTKDDEDESDDEDDEEEEEKDSGEEKYIVNGLFGTEDNSSMVRVVLSTKSKASVSVCDMVGGWRGSKRDDLGLYKEARTPKDFIAEGADKKEVCQVLRNLMYNGVLFATT